MQWFVQTPEYSFKNTLSHSILLDVFSLGFRHPEYRAGVQEPFSYGVVRLRRMTFRWMILSCLKQGRYGRMRCRKQTGDPHVHSRAARAGAAAHP